jgi:colanic acid/amylovoran biosynthesis glycosyltransferase
MTHDDSLSIGPDAQEPAEPVRILAVGDLVPGSGFLDLLRTFRDVARWHPRARLIVVGEGPERAALDAFVLEAHLAECVGLPGRVERACLVEWMQRAHVFAIPAARATRTRMPPSLPVAMAGGLCVVAPHGAASARVLEDGVNGLLFDAGEEGAQLRALQLAVSNEALRRRLGEAAAASVRGGERRSA